MGRTSSGSYRQIRVGRTVVGVVGLEEIFAALLKEGAQPSEEVMPELLARVRRYNYIAPAAEDEYTEALWREFLAFCQHAEKDRATGYGTWRGYRRETIPWYPTIRAELCDGCGACLRFCSYGVLAPADDGRAQVVEPFKCLVGCSACERTCELGAITFPSRQVLELFGG